MAAAKKPPAKKPTAKQAADAKKAAAATKKAAAAAAATAAAATAAAATAAAARAKKKPAAKKSAKKETKKAPTAATSTKKDANLRGAYSATTLAASMAEALRQAGVGTNNHPATANAADEAQSMQELGISHKDSSVMLGEVNNTMNCLVHHTAKGRLGVTPCTETSTFDSMAQMILAPNAASAIDSAQAPGAFLASKITEAYNGSLTGLQSDNKMRSANMAKDMIKAGMLYDGVIEQPAEGEVLMGAKPLTDQDEAEDNRHDAIEMVLGPCSGLLHDDPIQGAARQALYPVAREILVEFFKIAAVLLFARRWSPVGWRYASDSMYQALYMDVQKWTAIVEGSTTKHTLLDSLKCNKTALRDLKASWTSIDPHSGVPTKPANSTTPKALTPMVSQNTGASIIGAAGTPGGLNASAQLVAPPAAPFAVVRPDGRPPCHKCLAARQTDPSVYNSHTAEECQAVNPDGSPRSRATTRNHVYNGRALEQQQQAAQFQQQQPRTFPQRQQYQQPAFRGGRGNGGGNGRGNGRGNGGHNQGYGRGRGYGHQHQNNSWYY